MPEDIGQSRELIQAVPTRTYDLSIHIRDKDYTQDLVSLTILNSLSSAYPIVTLGFLVDPNDIIINDLFGEDPIKLGITLLGYNAIPGPKTDFDLMYLKSDFQLTEKDEASRSTQVDRSVLIITTVARKAYKVMTSLVNKVYIGTTVSEMINDLAGDVNATIKLDTDSINSVPIPQVCIPPTTFYKIIKEHSREHDDIFDGFIDQRFGIFDGTPGVFSDFDGTVYVKNLTSKMTKNQTFTIYQVASPISSEGKASTIDNIIDRVREKEDTFYTYDLINTDYAATAKFATLASTLNHIVKPDKTLSQIVTQTLKAVGTNYSLIHKNPDIPIDSNVERIKYYNEDTGNDLETTLFNSRFGRTVADLSTLSMNIEKNLPVLPLLKVGECVKFKPMTLEYAPLDGKYILWSTTIAFVREGDWATVARINLIRTNKKS